jgi:hypothetical protein
MFRKAIFALVAAAGLGVAVVPASAAGPAGGLTAWRTLGSDIEQASFWAQPFPYGYRWRPSGCVRHVAVETPWGPAGVPCGFAADARRAGREPIATAPFAS